jgi:hypothetical protein
MHRTLLRALAVAGLAALALAGCGTSGGSDAKKDDKTVASDGRDDTASDLSSDVGSDESSDEVSSDDVGSDVSSDEYTDVSSDDGGDQALEGDGSDWCFTEDDLPDGFLPLTGEDSTSNSMSYVFDDPAVSDLAQQHLTGSWLVLPEGGAGPDDLTADCSVYVFDTVDAAAEAYDWYAGSYPDRASPSPEEQELTSDVPGEDPHLYTKDVGGRPNADVIFRYRNVIVDVGISGSTSNDSEQVAGATEELAGVTYGHLEGN